MKFESVTEPETPIRRLKKMHERNTIVKNERRGQSGALAHQIIVIKLPVSSSVKDCNNTNKNKVFDSSKVLQHSTSQGKYSSGCVDNAFANTLMFSTFIEDIFPESNF